MKTDQTVVVGEFVCEVLVPLRTLDRGVYVCDKRFHIAEFEDYFRESSRRVHGLVFGTGDSMGFYVVADDEKGAKPELVKTVNVPGGTRVKGQKKGGQSSARFGRIHDNQVAAFAKLVAETCNEVFLTKNGRPSIVTLVFGGTGGDKTGIYALAARSTHLNKYLAALNLGLWPATSCLELVQSSAAARAKFKTVLDDRYVHDFLQHVRLGTGRAIYGEQELVAHRKNLEVVIHSAPDELWKNSWKKSFLESLGPKTILVESSHQTVTQFGGLIGISFFSVQQ